MAINKNHEFEELNGVKCGIVEKNVKPERVAFLKDLLEYNGFTVVVAPTPPPKASPVAVPKPANPVTPTPLPPEGGNSVSESTADIQTETQPEPPPPPPPPETFTVGVTDITFNPINAIFGRLLKGRNGNVITLAYWNQEEAAPDDSVPYYEKK